MSEQAKLEQRIHGLKKVQTSMQKLLLVAGNLSEAEKPQQLKALTRALAQVKAIRAGRMNIKESYVVVKNGEIFLIGMHITPLPTASTHVDPDPTRTRKLLLHAEEISKLIGKVERAGYALMPLDLHYTRGRIKLEVGQQTQILKQAISGSGIRFVSGNDEWWEHQGEASYRHDGILVFIGRRK